MTRPRPLRAGLYHESLENYFRYFSRDRFHIEIFEEMIANPEDALVGISKFLQNRSGRFQPPAPRNGGESKSKHQDGPHILERPIHGNVASSQGV